MRQTHNNLRQIFSTVILPRTARNCTGTVRRVKSAANGPNYGILTILATLPSQSANQLTAAVSTRYRDSSVCLFIIFLYYSIISLFFCNFMYVIEVGRPAAPHHGPAIVPGKSRPIEIEENGKEPCSAVKGELQQKLQWQESQNKL